MNDQPPKFSEEKMRQVIVYFLERINNVHLSRRIPTTAQPALRSGSGLTVSTPVRLCGAGQAAMLAS